VGFNPREVLKMKGVAGPFPRILAAPVGKQVGADPPAVAMAAAIAPMDGADVADAGERAAHRAPAEQI